VILARLALQTSLQCIPLSRSISSLDPCRRISDWARRWKTQKLKHWLQRSASDCSPEESSCDYCDDSAFS